MPTPRSFVPLRDRLYPEPYCFTSNVSGPGSTSFSASFTCSTSGLVAFQSAPTVLPLSLLAVTLSTQTASGDRRCNVSSRPTISASRVVRATVHVADCELRSVYDGPSKRSNPHDPCIVAVTVCGRLAASSEALSTVNPPFAAFALADSSTVFPLRSRSSRVKLCPRSVPKMSGAPSAGRTSPFFCAQKTCFGIDRAKRRRRRAPDRRQANHDHRFRIAKRWRIVQLQIERLAFRQRQRRNVLILGGVGAAQNAHHINHRADIRVESAARHVRRVGDLRQQVGRGSRKLTCRPCSACARHRVQAGCCSW